MAKMDSQVREDDEAPLDPAAERLRRKLTWLLVGSIGVMVLGLIAVFAAIVYRVGEMRAPAAPPAAEAVAVPEAAEIALPPGARLVAAELDGQRLLARIELGDGASRLMVIDLRSGEVTAAFDLVPEGPPGAAAGQRD